MTVSRPSPSATDATPRTAPRAALLLALTGTVLATLVLLTVSPSSAGERIDPAALPSGPAPRIAHLVHDTIRDGDLSLPAPGRGRHDALWVVSGGYLLRDYNVGPHRLVRVVFVDVTGARRVIARSHQWIDVQVAPGGGRVAVAHPSGPPAQRTAIMVVEPASGRVVARRELRLATLVAVTRSRVLLAVRARWHHPETVWWSYERGRTRTLLRQAAVSADVVHDRMVLLTPRVGEFCHRLVALSRPGRTLSRSCQRMPHAWSPDGTHALSTWAYFDAAGTDRWWVVDGRATAPSARIVGRLDWHAVWEDDAHFLVAAQGDTGGASVIRCDLDGACERALQLWDTPLPTEPSLYYRSPPVVLAEQ